MEIVPGSIAEHVELDAIPVGCIHHNACFAKIKGDLKEATIVVEAHATAHADRVSPRDCFARHGTVGQTAHHTVGDQGPSVAGYGDGRVKAQVVDDLGGF